MQKRAKNKLLHLIIDSHTMLLKRVYYITAGKLEDALVETRSVWIDFTNKLILSVDKEEYGICVCEFLLNSLKQNHNQKFYRKKRG